MYNTITLSFFSLMNFTLCFLLRSSLNSSMNKGLLYLKLQLFKTKVQILNLPFLYKPLWEGMGSY